MRNDYSRFVKKGDYVYCNNVKIQILSPIGIGEEGVIYKTDTPYVCKIYKDQSLDYLKLIKIQEMLKIRITREGICWPLGLIYNKNNIFVGYLMNKAYGKELETGIFNKETLLKQHPDWTRREVVQLTLTILDKINYLHYNNIIIGDINTENILVVSEKEVYFVDTDSYQINGIPCPVGTEIFTAPEIGQCMFSDILRSYGNEYFAVATLVFMILMQGLTPYIGKTSIEMVKNIRRYKFPYYLNDKIDIQLAFEKNVYLWSHLPQFLKEAFVSTFSKYGKHSYENTRYTTEEWIFFMKKYLYLLDTGSIGNEDSMSEKLFPTRNKIYSLKK